MAVRALKATTSGYAEPKLCAQVLSHAMDVGALTPFLWGFEEREKLMEFYGPSIPLAHIVRAFCALQ
jgi:hypothetical protein